jgi:hypothetical protein
VIAAKSFSNIAVPETSRQSVDIGTGDVLGADWGVSTDFDGRGRCSATKRQERLKEGVGIPKCAVTILKALR